MWQKFPLGDLLEPWERKIEGGSLSIVLPQTTKSNQASFNLSLFPTTVNHETSQELLTLWANSIYIFLVVLVVNCNRNDSVARTLNTIDRNRSIDGRKWVREEKRRDRRGMEVALCVYRETLFEQVQLEMTEDDGMSGMVVPCFQTWVEIDNRIIDRNLGERERLIWLSKADWRKDSVRQAHIYTDKMSVCLSLICLAHSGNVQKSLSPPFHLISQMY